MSDTHIASSRLSDPGAAGLLTFGMALLYVDVVDHDARGAHLAGPLVAGLYQSICSILEHIRGAPTSATCAACSA